MQERVFWAERNIRNLSQFALLIAVVCLPAKSLCSSTCSVQKHDPLSEADKALRAADFVKAASLYQSELTSHPENADLTIGLVHALLHQQKVQEAEDAVKAALSNTPNSAALITLRGEVEYRQGTPWTAAESAITSLKLDPCNPRTRLLLSDLDRLNSLYATSRALLQDAHRLDPADPEIRLEWIGTLPLKRQITELEAYLSAPMGDDADDTRHLRQDLERMKKKLVEPHKGCHLVSPVATTEIPFDPIMHDATHRRGFGLDVKLNGHNSLLEIDTGAGGLLITRSAAKHAGIKPFSATEMGGVGDEGYKPGYSAYADSIRIGNLEFQDCPVSVMDSRGALEDADGLIGMDVFSRFLVTLNYPMHRLLLGPLPQRPGESGADLTLKTNDEETDDSEDAEEPAKAEKQENSAANSGAATTTQRNAAPIDKPHGPYDRYIAPEMKDYTRIYRVGHLLILPAGLNFEKIRLFVLDTGAWATTISPIAAREVTKVHSDDNLHIRGISGDVKQAFRADNITFRFAQLSQKVEGVVAFDNSRLSKDAGIELSGFLGASTLNHLTIHIDYRDGLVKFDYDPKHDYNF
jgi:tetratricopeptide (TPR) repeat protein